MKKIIAGTIFALMAICSLASLEATAQTYTYDEAGRLTGVLYADGSTISYQYDKNGNLLERKTKVFQSGVEEGADNSESRSLLASPNPTSGGTTISFNLSGESGVVAVVVDVLGNQIATLSLSSEEESRGEIYWNGMTSTGTVTPSGIYQVQLQSEEGEVVATTKVILTR
ncbi:MAG: RHS repeat protein [Ignavibacteriae bacterium]|nr:RHS repeat protein [Ignavibacteriota bacterium]MCB9217728.1 RHS repeat protein [Ignavibacteria bacterium]